MCNNYELKLFGKGWTAGRVVGVEDRLKKQLTFSIKDFIFFLELGLYPVEPRET